MQTTPRHALPCIAAAQAQKHITHNEALDRIDRLIGLRLLSRSLLTPPPAPANGDCFAVPGNATGAWAEQSGKLASFEGGAWSFDAPPAGLQAYCHDEGAVLVFDGNGWRETHAAADRFDKIGLGISPHATAPLMLQGEEAIFTSAPSGSTSESCRLSVNKVAASATASMVFQNGWQGRAEIGLPGSDDFAIKVSNGTTWRTALCADRQNGNVMVPNKLIVGDSPTSVNGVTIARAAPALSLRDTAGTGASHLSLINFVDKDGVEKVWCGLGSSSNTEFTFLSHYADGITFYAYGGNNPIQFLQNGQKRLRIHTNGYVGVQEPAPTAPLHVNGGARVGNYAKAQLPAAATLGAGTIVYVSDDAAGATLAFSDGTTWRRAHDRQPVA